MFGLKPIAFLFLEICCCKPNQKNNVEVRHVSSGPWIVQIGQGIGLTVTWRSPRRVGLEHGEPTLYIRPNLTRYVSSSLGIHLWLVYERQCRVYVTLNLYKRMPKKNWKVPISDICPNIYRNLWDPHDVRKWHTHLQIFTQTISYGCVMFTLQQRGSHKF